MSPMTNDWVPFRDAQSTEGHKTMEAQIGAMQPGTRKCGQPPEAGRGRQTPPPEPPEEALPPDTLMSDLWPPDE